MRIRTVEAIVETLNQKAVGQEVRGFQVLGINSLKTPAPPERLIGQRMEGAAQSDGRVVLLLGRFEVEIDLQRTGVLNVLNHKAAWTIGEGPMPTVRLSLSRETFDFTEPAKTKRIAVWVKERHVDE